MKVISSWIEGISAEKLDQSCNDDSQFLACVNSGPQERFHQSEKPVWACQHSKTGKRKQIEPDSPCYLPGMHPIDEILRWHNAIKRELIDIIEVAKKKQLSCEASDWCTSHIRLKFIADVCDFQRYCICW